MEVGPPRRGVLPGTPALPQWRENTVVCKKPRVHGPERPQDGRGELGSWGGRTSRTPRLCAGLCGLPECGPGPGVRAGAAGPRPNGSGLDSKVPEKQIKQDLRFWRSPAAPDLP